MRLRPRGGVAGCACAFCTFAEAAEVADVFTFVAIAACAIRRSAEPKRTPEATLVEALTRTASAARAHRVT